MRIYGSVALWCVILDEKKTGEKWTGFEGLNSRQESRKGGYLFSLSDEDSVYFLVYFVSTLIYWARVFAVGSFFGEILGPKFIFWNEKILEWILSLLAFPKCQAYTTKYGKEVRPADFFHSSNWQLSGLGIHIFLYIF